MQGDNTLWLPGTDHAGIATQKVVERNLKKTEGKGATTWAARRSSGACGSGVASTAAHPRAAQEPGRLLRLGPVRFTMDDGLSRAVRKVFVRSRARANLQGQQWSTGARAAARRSRTSRSSTRSARQALAHRLPVQGLGPELGGRDHASRDHARRHRGGGAPRRPALPGHRPQDGHAASAGPAHYRSSADERVDPAFGPAPSRSRRPMTSPTSRSATTTSSESVQAIGQDGRITAAGGPYAGLVGEGSRGRVWVADLQKIGALVKVEDYTHSVATCDRCGTPSAAYQRAVVHAYGRAQGDRLSPWCATAG